MITAASASRKLLILREYVALLANDLSGQRSSTRKNRRDHLGPFLDEGTRDSCAGAATQAGLTILRLREAFIDHGVYQVDLMEWFTDSHIGDSRPGGSRTCDTSDADGASASQ